MAGPTSCRCRRKPPGRIGLVSYVRLENLDDERRRIPASLLRVPMIRQQTGFSCGAAALQSVLQYWGRTIDDERLLYNRLGTKPEGGTRPKSIATVARELGLDAVARQLLTHDDLYWATKRGETVILSLQRWGANLPEEECTDGHFVVLMGIMGDDDEEVFVMDPYTGTVAWMPASDLLDRWHDRAWPGEPCDRRVAIFVKGKKAHPAPLPTGLASRYR